MTTVQSSIYCTKYILQYELNTLMSKRVKFNHFMQSLFYNTKMLLTMSSGISQECCYDVVFQLFQPTVSGIAGDSICMKRLRLFQLVLFSKSRIRQNMTMFTHSNIISFPLQLLLRWSCEYWAMPSLPKAEAESCISRPASLSGIQVRPYLMLFQQ